MSVTIYGIKNCDTMKKARKWLADHGKEVVFHDYKIAGIDTAHLQRWCGEAGWDNVINRAGMTFRKLTDTDKQNLDMQKAIKLMHKQPSMIKRPILEFNGRLLIGFKAEDYERFFSEA